MFPDTLSDVRTITEWAIRNPDRVQIMTFIAVRMAHPDDPWDYLAGGKKVDMSESPYLSVERYRSLTAHEMYEEIRAVLPHFGFNAYLGGTALPHSVKWAIGSHVCTKQVSFGNTGPKTMELLQNGHHFLLGRYLAYTKPSLNRKGRSTLLLALIDKGLREALRRYVSEVVRRPSTLFRRAFIQSISVVQPVDILPTGEADTCDGCPNKTYWNGRLVSACRWEEYENYGAPLTMSPKANVS